MTIDMEKLIKTLESTPQLEPSNELHQKVMQRINDIPKLATLGTTIGDVRVQRKDSTNWELAYQGIALFSGDKLATKEGGKTFLVFKDGTQLWLNQNTELEISPSTRNIYISLGEILAFVTRRKKGEKEFSIGTPAGLLEVLGTEFDTTVSRDRVTILTVLKGSVRFKNEQGETKVKSNTTSRAKADVKPTIPVRTDTAQITTWASDLANQGKEQNLDVPGRLLYPKQELEQNPINLILIILLLVAAGILGYVLGYLYGKF